MRSEPRGLRCHGRDRGPRWSLCIGPHCSGCAPRARTSSAPRQPGDRWWPVRSWLLSLTFPRITRTDFQRSPSRPVPSLARARTGTSRLPRSVKPHTRLQCRVAEPGLRDVLGRRFRRGFSVAAIPLWRKPGAHTMPAFQSETLMEPDRRRKLWEDHLETPDSWAIGGQQQ
jgi:hypothetical protein